MPELPEVETIRLGLSPSLEKKVITKIVVRRRNLRIPIPKTLELDCINQKILSLSRRAKYLLIHLENGKTIIIHLGMSGKLTLQDKKSSYEKHDHVIFEFENGLQVRFNDPRRFGLTTLTDTCELHKNKLLSHLGVEPLTRDFNAQYLYQKLKNRKTPIKSTLMDNKIVVGVGNIYASESLFNAGISPLKKSMDIPLKSLEKLEKSIKSILREAIKSGGSSLKDHRQSDGTLGYFQHNFKVYGKFNKKCLVCQTTIKSEIIAGRNTFYCPSCQK